MWFKFDLPTPLTGFEQSAPRLHVNDNFRNLFQGLITVINDIDPGQCDQSNHASQVLILDRENKEKILICTKNNGVYQWETLGGMYIDCDVYNYIVLYINHTQLVQRLSPLGSQVWSTLIWEKELANRLLKVVWVFFGFLELPRWKSRKKFLGGVSESCDVERIRYVCMSVDHLMFTKLFKMHWQSTCTVNIYMQSLYWNCIFLSFISFPRNTNKQVHLYFIIYGNSCEVSICCWPICIFFSLPGNTANISITYNWISSFHCV